MPSNLGYNKNNVVESFEAFEALPAFVGVIRSAEGVVRLPQSAGQRIIGVTARAAAIGEQVEVVISGITAVKVKTATSLGAGDLAGFHTDGGAYRPAASSGLFAGARLINAPATSGDIVQAYVDLGMTLTF